MNSSWLKYANKFKLIFLSAALLVSCGVGIWAMLEWRAEVEWEKTYQKAWKEYGPNEHITSPILNQKVACGEGVWYILDDQGNMTISGSGEMTDYLRNYWFPWAGFRDAIKTVKIEKGVRGTLPGYAFYNCSKLRKVTISGDITEIGASAFNECVELTTVNLGNGITTINPWAFERCDSLKSIVLPNSVKEISWGAFYECKSLETITLGNSVESIDYSAFNGCEKLTSITLPKTLKFLQADTAFYGTAVTDIYFEGSKSQWDKLKFDYKEFFDGRKRVYVSNRDNAMKQFAEMGITIHYE